MVIYSTEESSLALCAACQSFAAIKIWDFADDGSDLHLCKSHALRLIKILASDLCEIDEESLEEEDL